MKIKAIDHESRKIDDLDIQILESNDVIEFGDVALEEGYCYWAYVRNFTMFGRKTSNYPHKYGRPIKTNHVLDTKLFLILPVNVSDGGSEFPMLDMSVVTISCSEKYKDSIKTFLTRRLKADLNSVLIEDSVDYNFLPLNK
jgi:hypothetical protein